MTIIAYLILGIGLFIFGVSGVNKGFQRLGLAGLSKLVLKLSSHPLLAGIWAALVTGMMTDFMPVLFPLASLVTTQTVSLLAILPMIVWSNVGLISPFYLMAISIDVLVFTILGLSAIMVTILHTNSKLRNIFQILLSVCLILFGLHHIVHGVHLLEEVSWYQNALKATGNSLFYPFLMGLALRFITQELVIVIVIGLANYATSLVSLDQLIFLFSGNFFGIGILNFFESRHLKDGSRQVLTVETVYNFCCGISLLIFMLFSLQLTLFSIENILAYFGPSIDFQIANFIVFIMAAMAIIFMILKFPIVRFVERICPLTLEVEPGKPKYLDETALGDPYRALELVDKEQLRLIEQISYQLEDVRNEKEIGKINPIHKRHEANLSLSNYIQSYLVKIAQQGSMNTENFEHLFNDISQQSYILPLEEQVFQFCTEIITLEEESKPKKIAKRFLEALDFMLLNIMSYMETKDTETIDLMLSMMTEQSEVYEELRKNFLASDTKFGEEEKLQLLDISLKFERSVILIQKLTQLFKSEHEILQKQLQIRDQWTKKIQST